MHQRFLSYCLFGVAQLLIPFGPVLAHGGGGGGFSGDGHKEAPKKSPFIELKDGKWEEKYLQILSSEGRTFEEKRWRLTDKQWSEMKSTLKMSFRSEDRTSKYYGVTGEEAKSLGWIFVFTLETSEGKASVGVAIGIDGLIRSVGILVLNNTFPIAGPSFLDQFKDRGLASDWSFGRGVNLLEGYEKEGKSLSEGLQKALYFSFFQRSIETRDPLQLRKFHQRT